MKKLLTLFAFLVCALGANAVEIVDAYVDFSKYTDISEVKWAGWGASEEARSRLSIKDGCLHFESAEATDPSWACQFHPIGIGSNAEIDVTYTLHFKIKGDHAGNVSMLGFGQTPYGQFSITDEWVEGAVDYEATSSDGNLLMQCGDWVGSFDIAYLKITHEGREEKPIDWMNILENGDAEGAFGDIPCAQRKEFGILDEGQTTGEWIHEAEIIDDPDGTSGQGKVFHTQSQIVNPVIMDGDCPSAANTWQNMFWIVFPRPLVGGEGYKVSFKYKASEAVRVSTQAHRMPGDYLGGGFGDVNFTTSWQTYESKELTAANSGTYQSIAFLFGEDEAYLKSIDFYFDDIKIEVMNLKEGFFAAGIDTNTDANWNTFNFDNAVEFAWDEDLAAYVGVVGTAGDQDSWVNQVMVSTKYGNDKGFKANTVKVTGCVQNDPEQWLPYSVAAKAPINLPARGVWQIAVDTNEELMNFIKLEGEEDKEPVDIVTNTTEVIVNATERDWKPEGEDEVGTGQPWDNQFWIVANRVLEAGEETVVEFDYVANKNASTLTQTHGAPGAYVHWAAIGDVNFDTEWQHFEREFTIPAEAADRDAQSIAFCMAVIKEACNYTITNVRWYVKSDMEGMTYENLIDAEGTKNFYVKEGAGTSPHEFTGITPIQDVDLVLNLSDGANISDEIAAALDGNVARNIEINLHEGGYYTYTNSIMASGSITLYGNGATIDASNSSQALIAMERKSDATDWTEVSLHVDGVTILGMNNSLIWNNNNKYYVYRSVVVDNCIVNVANNISYPIFDFRNGSTVLDFSVTGSTFYAPADIRTREFYSSQSGQRPTDYSEYATQKFIFAGNTIYNIAKGRNFFAHRATGQSWMSFEIMSNLFVDCGRQGRVIRGFNGDQASGNPSWYVSGNAFNYDGEDTGEMEISNDTYGKIESTVFGVMNFNDPYNGDFNGEFTLPYDAIAPQMLGDQRWTIVYQNAQAPDFINILYFDEAPEFMKGQDNELSVNLQNERQIMACQFDLVLPSGVYLNNIYNVWRSETHSVSFNMLTDGTIRVVVVSTEGVPFYDNNGEILNMVFNVDGGLSEGDYTLGMKNIEMTTSNYETLRPEDQYITVHVKDLLMGDVDSNGQINVTDVVMIIDDILGKTQWNFNKDVADVNSDSYINVTDVVLVIDHVLGKVNLNRAAATDAEMGAISLSSDMTTVSLTNPSAYTAFQMDVTLPKGVILEDVLLTERAARSHSVVIREMENGSYRIVGVSMKNDAFKGNVGDLLQLQLTGNAQGSVAIDNVLFVTPQGVQHELAGVNAFGDVTGISATLTNNGQMNNDNQYTLDGRKLNGKPMTKGIYVNGGRKVVIK